MASVATLAPPTATPGTHQVNVRFDEPTRVALERVASTQDRTLTQLVRYAVTWWVTQPADVRRAGETLLSRTQVINGRHVNVRLPISLLDQIDQYTLTITGVDRSGTIRAAVRAWLTISTTIFRSDFLAMRHPQLLPP